MSEYYGVESTLLGVSWYHRGLYPDLSQAEGMCESLRLEEPDRGHRIVVYSRCEVLE